MNCGSGLEKPQQYPCVPDMLDDYDFSYFQDPHESPEQDMAIPVSSSKKITCQEGEQTRTHGANMQGNI